MRFVDRSIQAYERSNDRGHVIYANVAMPYQINHSNLRAFAEHNFPNPVTDSSTGTPQAPTSSTRRPGTPPATPPAGLRSSRSPPAAVST